MRPSIFQYEEPKYFGFGLRLGMANALRNGLRLGPKKTLGKILQPINSYTRFPEYHFIGTHVEQYVLHFDPRNRVKILDVGSPKCLGLYLAYRFSVEVHLTDIYEPAVEESKILWDAIKDRAKGKAVFSVQDGRATGYSEGYFDLVYSMSVIEHVEGEAGDSDSIREMIRVLKPGGLLLATVPIGQRYIEQDRVGVQGAARETRTQGRYFFQRIYAPAEVERRIISAAMLTELRETISIQRKMNLLSRVYRNLGANLRALLGWMNPLLSAALNFSHEGIMPGASEYGKTHTHRDVYGDLFLRWKKTPPVRNLGKQRSLATDLDLRFR